MEKEKDFENKDDMRPMSEDSSEMSSEASESKEKKENIETQANSDDR
jgi:hypothetical protein